VLTAGQEVDRYVVERLLGRGGMAAVYLVRHRTLGTWHALKVLTLTAPRLVDRLVQEGQVQARLRHPNIVAVTDVFDVGGAPGLLMEYIPGASLDHHLPAGGLPEPEVERLFRGIVAGVSHAHAQGVVHRDLKPANVLIEQGTPKVSDFGLAKLVAELDAGVGQTRSGAAMGTPNYMAPEQVRDARSVDSRADLWSLGCLLYELLTGRRAFDGPDVLAVYNAVANGHYVGPERLRPGLDPRWTVLLRACLEVDRERRVADGPSLLRLLDTPRPVWMGPTLSPGPDTLVHDGPPAAPAAGPEALTASSFPGRRGLATWSDAPADAAPPELVRRWSPSSLGLGLAALLSVGVAGTLAAGLASRSAAPPPAPAELAVAPAPVAPVSPVPPAPEPTRSADPTAVAVAAPAAKGASAAPAPSTLPAADVDAGPVASRPPDPGAATGAPILSLTPAASSPGAVASGRVELNAIPWAQLEIDGEARGSTPFKGELSAGRHRVRFRTEDGATYEEVVSVPAGGVSQLCWSFELAARCPD